MPKNIVMCLDGTGNQLKAKGNTNVVRLYEMLKLGDPDRQVAFYDPGVGTFSAAAALTPIARVVTKLLGLAFGYGLRANLAEAYTYLMRTYEPGDRVYLFGFSRGAYTARALAGMLHRAGLLRRGAENLVPYAVRAYARTKREWTQEDWERIDKYARVFSLESGGSRSVPIHFMGLWDSVKAVGILRWRVQWPYTRQLPNVETVSHAVSIDEKRRPYQEYLVFPKDGRPRLREVWFSGVHTDVGGTFEDDPRLAEIALKWMVEEAVDAGLEVDGKAYRKACTLQPDHDEGTVHRMGWFWVFLTYRRRPITSGGLVHDSVRTRMEKKPGYRPKLPDGISWDDTDWLTLRPVP